MEIQAVRQALVRPVLLYSYIVAHALTIVTSRARAFVLQFTSCHQDPAADTESPVRMHCCRLLVFLLIFLDQA